MSVSRPEWRPSEAASCISNTNARFLPPRPSDARLQICRGDAAAKGPCLRIPGPESQVWPRRRGESEARGRESKSPRLCRVASPCVGQADMVRVTARDLSRRRLGEGGRLWGPCQLTELAASGPHASSQRGPATGPPPPRLRRGLAVASAKAEAGTCRSIQMRAVSRSAPDTTVQHIETQMFLATTFVTSGQSGLKPRPTSPDPRPRAPSPESRVVSLRRRVLLEVSLGEGGNRRHQLRRIDRLRQVNVKPRPQCLHAIVGPRVRRQGGCG